MGVENNNYVYFDNKNDKIIVNESKFNGIEGKINNEITRGIDVEGNKRFLDGLRIIKNQIENNINSMNNIIKNNGIDKSKYINYFNKVINDINNLVYGYINDDNVSRQSVLNELGNLNNNSAIIISDIVKKYKPISNKIRKLFSSIIGGSTYVEAGSNYFSNQRKALDNIK